MSWTLLLALALTVEDPRMELVQLQLADHNAEALQRTQQLLAEQPELSRRIGLDYLEAHLLAEAGRTSDSGEAFARALSSAPDLEPYSRYRLAVELDRQDHPEVAAGLVANLLASGAPRPLLSRAVQMLRHTLDEGGDCRVLKGLDLRRFPTPERRQLTFTQARCDLRFHEEERGQRIFRALLEEDQSDEVAREAVEQVAMWRRGAGEVETTLLIGLTLHRHREFSRSVHYLEMALLSAGAAGGTLSSKEEYEARYALTRGRFWLGKYNETAAGFEDLAKRTNVPDERAQALFQRGRSLELVGRWADASDAFRLAYNADVTGRWADAALFGALRLEWRTGNEASALTLYDLLLTRHSWRGMAARAALFLASSDLVQGRADRAEPWLDLAAAGRDTSLEAAYWRGRLLELRDDPTGAVASYLEALRAEPQHPLAQAARRRLAGSTLAPVARREGRRLAGSARVADLRSAWLLLEGDANAGEGARKALEAALRRDRAAAPFLELELVPVEQWPLWQAVPRQAEDRLLALGLWQDGAPAVRRHFPMSQPSLALTGGYLLARGGAANQSLRIAEILAQAVPSEVPFELLPPIFQQLLYPSAYDDLIVERAALARIDPELLQAIIREESRYNPEAFSASSARGLTQFVMPTARKLAFQIGLGPLRPDDLYSPPLSIALGAAYLGELLQEFGGADHAAIAAYNAGEPLAHLWRNYCFTREPEEFFTKVGYKETRDYLRKVSGSYYRYRQIYGDKIAVGGEPRRSSRILLNTEANVSWRGARVPPK